MGHKNRNWRKGIIPEEAPALEPITYDLIRNLRLQGRHFDAEKLLEAYHKNKRESKEREKEESDALQRKVIYFLRKKEGLCTYRQCENPATNGIMCKEHKRILSERTKKDREQRVLAGICTYTSCKNEAAYGRLMCDYHYQQKNHRR